MIRLLKALLGKRGNDPEPRDVSVYPRGLFLEAPVPVDEYGAYDDSEFEDDGCPNCGYVE